MSEEEKRRLAEFLAAESCGVHICEKCGKCKVCNNKCDIETKKLSTP